jgi:hypothetical protein
MTHPSQPQPTPADDPAFFHALASRAALASAALVALMFGIFAVTGVGQDPLQYLHPVPEYTAILLKNPPVLRAAIGLDNLFIVAYSTMFLGLGALLWRRTAWRAVLGVALALLAATAVLDLFENMHFLAMIAASTQGLEIGAGEIGLQVWESLVKFHLSYLGLFLLSFVLPRETAVERALVVLLRWVQLPVGLLIYLTPPPIAVPLVMARFAFFLVASLMVASAFRPNGSGSGAPA